MLVVHSQKNKAKIEKFVQIGNTNFIYKKGLDKACFQHDMAYGKSKYLVKIAQLDKVLKDKVFNIASDPKYDGYQRESVSMIYKFFDKISASLNKSRWSGFVNEPNYQLENELHKPVIQTFKKENFIHLLETIFGVLI